ncbi:DUF2125 domain-containing protein [Thioclava sp. BHET1]|nr:DUF2125 domain-containing protein [Thioclava sp. BHET1]
MLWRKATNHPRGVMAQKIWLGSTALVAALLAGQVAKADLTPDQVWSQWHGLLQGTGRTVSVGQIDHSSDGLVVHDVELTTSRKDVRSVIHLNEVRYRQRRDGAVAVFGPDRITLSLTSGAGKNMSFDLHSPGEEGPMAIVQGTKDDMTIDTPKGDHKLLIDHMIADGEPLDLTASLGMNGLTGTMHLTTAAEGQDFSGKTTIESISVSAEGKAPKKPAQADGSQDPGDLTHFDFQAGVTDLGYDIKGRLPPMPADQPVSAFPLSDFHLAGSSGPGTATLNLDGAKGPASIDASFDGTALVEKIASPGLFYRLSQTGLKLQIKAANMPVSQAGISLDHSALEVKLPMQPSDQPQDMSLALALDGLGLSPEIWKRLDPQSQLPHDPATLDLDLSGKVRLLLNLLDPKTYDKLAAQSKTIPLSQVGSLDALTLDKLHLSAVGAELNGHGAVTFDNSRPGPPSPIGAVDLSAKGIQSLIDALGAMGILPKDKSMGAMMMLALFARPGDGPDTLVSKIEFKTGGTIYVNGQRIR